MDIFVALNNNLRQLPWFRGVGGYLDDKGKGISLDNEGNVICSGEFYSPATFVDNNVLSRASKFIGLQSLVQWKSCLSQQNTLTNFFL